MGRLYRLAGGRRSGAGGSLGIIPRMPELPEVETVARELREGRGTRGPSVVGRVIERVIVKWPRHIARPAPREVMYNAGGGREAGA